MWNLIETLLLVACVVGCGTAPPAELTVGQIVSDPSPDKTSTPDNSSPVVAPSSSPQVVATVQHLTYYRLSRTDDPVNGWPTKTYTATGSCIIYQSKTYCWDDGFKVLTWTSGGSTYGPFQYTYWSIGLLSNGNFSLCGGSMPINGGCATDVMTSPKVTSSPGHIKSNINSAVTTLLNTGTTISVDCTDTNGILDCGTFQVDTNQTPL